MFKKIDILTRSKLELSQNLSRKYLVKIIKLHFSCQIGTGAEIRCGKMSSKQGIIMKSLDICVI